MLRTPRVTLAAVVALTLVSTSSIALGDPWVPLTTGTHWEYIGDGGAHEAQTIIGQTLVRGAAVAVKSTTGGPDDGLQNYWLLDADGSLLLAGFLSPSAALALSYEPPIRWLPVPPGVGPQPVQHIIVHDLNTDAVVDALDIQLELTGPVTLTLPAGTYLAVGIGQLPPPGPALSGRASLTLDGRRLPTAAPAASAATPTDWYSQGVGLVMYQSTQLFVLTGFGLPTPTVASTWGAIKRLYR